MTLDEQVNQKYVVALVNCTAVVDYENNLVYMSIKEVYEALTGIYIGQFGTVSGMAKAHADFPICVRQLSTAGVWSSEGNKLSFFAKSSYEDFLSKITDEKLRKHILTPTEVSRTFYNSLHANRYRNSIDPARILKSIDTLQ